MKTLASERDTDTTDAQELYEAIMNNLAENLYLAIAEDRYFSCKVELAGSDAKRKPKDAGLIGDKGFMTVTIKIEGK